MCADDSQIDNGTRKAQATLFAFGSCGTVTKTPRTCDTGARALPTQQNSSLHLLCSLACVRLTNYFLLCRAQARDHSIRADRGRAVMKDLGPLAESSWLHALLPRELATGQLLLPGVHSAQPDRAGHRPARACRAAHVHAQSLQTACVCPGWTSRTDIWCAILCRGPGGHASGYPGHIADFATRCTGIRAPASGHPPRGPRGPRIRAAPADDGCG